MKKEYWEDLEKLLQVTLIQREKNSSSSPILVHCRYAPLRQTLLSAGVGRTGTFIAIHSCLEILRYMQSAEYQAELDELRLNGSPEQKTILQQIESVFPLQEPRISVFAVVRKLKEQRWCMVKTRVSARKP